MPSQTMSPPLSVAVLAALWLGLGRCGVFESPGPECDNKKLSLERDLPADAVFWGCPMPVWPESTQNLSSIDTVYDPEPARQICTDKTISYSHTIPNSGAYRPGRAESGEYLYCPPQRWLNNLHNGAAVLLYHPCAPVKERHRLSVLARSCLPDYIMTPHQQLKQHMPIAFVSWGRTLELSTVASSDVCDWLETTTAARNRFSGVNKRSKYNLLLIFSVEQHEQKHTPPEEHSTKMKESLRRCCEQTISLLLNGAMEAELHSNVKNKNMKRLKQESKRRQRRAAIREEQKNIAIENIPVEANPAAQAPNSTIFSKTRNTQTDHNTGGPSADSHPGDTSVSDPPGQLEVLSKIQNQGAKARPTTHVGLNMSETKSLQLKSSESYKRRPETLALSSQDEGTESTKHRDTESAKHHLKEKDSRGDDGITNNEVVDVKEREVEKHSYTHYPKSKDASVPVKHSNLQPANNHDCEGCKEGEQCECKTDSATDVSRAFPRTPRTDEAAWAAAALGFLLVLLTLSVLHTRLYRHWRSPPSLYWHDQREDYDSVADVIHRRLRIAKRRRKRGRRQECVLLPSSSSSEELL